jgi:hypothetical protein
MNEPQIIEVTWGKTVNLGNFENVRLDLKARVNTGQNWREVLAALRELVRREELREKETRHTPPGED